MKKMFHLVLNMMLTGLILVGIGISFLMLTDSSSSENTSKMLKADYSTESIHNPRYESIKGNPKKWIILDVSEDYTTAKVLKENGYEYYMTIYSATNNTIDIEVNGEIHTFYYTKQNI